MVATEDSHYNANTLTCADLHKPIYNVFSALFSRKWKFATCASSPESSSRDHKLPDSSGEAEHSWLHPYDSYIFWPRVTVVVSTVSETDIGEATYTYFISRRNHCTIYIVGSYRVGHHASLHSVRDGSDTSSWICQHLVLVLLRDGLEKYDTCRSASIRSSACPATTLRRMESNQHWTRLGREWSVVDRVQELTFPAQLV